MKAIALDPGVTTGYAVGVIDEGKMLVVTGQERWNHLGLYAFLEDNVPDVIVCERFEFRKKSREGLELFSRELIGVANLYAQLFMAPPHTLKMQNAMKDSPSTYFNDNRLREDHIYKPGKDHSNDAARHLLYWFQFGSGFQYNQHGYESAA